MANEVLSILDEVRKLALAFKSLDDANLLTLEGKINAAKEALFDCERRVELVRGHSNQLIARVNEMVARERQVVSAELESQSKGEK